MTMKRSWEDDNRDVESFALANCLILLSHVNKSGSSSGRVFHCKTCNKPFQSFQALGGHRASHKRRKLMDDVGKEARSPPKAKTHECSICGMEFAIGQALGGHMRRHRVVNGGERSAQPVTVEKSRSKRGLCLDLNLTPYENDLKMWSNRKVVATI